MSDKSRPYRDYTREGILAFLTSGNKVDKALIGEINMRLARLDMLLAQDQDKGPTDADLPYPHDTQLGATLRDASLKAIQDGVKLMAAHDRAALRETCLKLAHEGPPVSSADHIIKRAEKYENYLLGLTDDAD